MGSLAAANLAVCSLNFSSALALAASRGVGRLPSRSGEVPEIFPFPAFGSAPWKNEQTCAGVKLIGGFRKCQQYCHSPP